MKKTKKFNTKVLAAVLAAVLVVALLTPSFASPKTSPFKDVPSDFWGLDAIIEFTEKGFISGYGGGMFGPNDPVTYGQFYTMLVRSQELIDNPASSNPYWVPFMDLAKDFDLFTGTLMENAYSNGKWDIAKADTPMTRYEMAQALYNYCQWFLTGAKINHDLFGTFEFTVHDEYGSDTYDPAEIAQQWLGTMYVYYEVDDHGPGWHVEIADKDAVPANYLDAVEYNYKYGLLRGMDSEGTFNGTGTLTRAQAVMVLYTLYYHCQGYLNPAEREKWDSYYGTGVELVNSTTAPATGYLTNGKPITEENIVEMLKELEKAYPHLSQWNGDSKYSFTSEVARQTVGLAKWEGCGSFAYMLTAQIFGDDPAVNPPRIHQNFDELKVGDIIVHMNKGDWAVTDWDKIGHFNIVLEVGEISGMKYLLTVGGNEAGGVAWAWSAGGYPAFSTVVDSNDYIISRW